MPRASRDSQAMYLTVRRFANANFIRGRMDINNNVSRFSNLATHRETSSGFYGENIQYGAWKEQKLERCSQVSRHLSSFCASSASPALIHRCIHYSGAKSFVSNGRCESFLG